MNVNAALENLLDRKVCQPGKKNRITRYGLIDYEMTVGSDFRFLEDFRAKLGPVWPRVFDRKTDIGGLFSFFIFLHLLFLCRKTLKMGEIC